MSVTFDNPYEEERPWGKFVQYTDNEPSTVKIITVNPGEAFSLQYHGKRTEFWQVLSGNGTIEVGDRTEDIVPGSRYVLPPHTNHRVTGGSEPAVFLEISTGDFVENDIVRLEDRYGRT